MIISLVIISFSILNFGIELTLDKSVCGFQFTEGPLWVKDVGWIFSDIPANTIFKLNRSVFIPQSGNSNGLAIDRKGRIFIAEHGNRCISVLKTVGGEREVYVNSFGDKRFNSPNDLVVSSKGEIFFTDPPYGLPGGLEGPNSELGFSGIFKVCKDKRVVLLNKNLKKPNGIALSNDESILFVADTEQDAVFKFRLGENKESLKEEFFASVPHPDGIKIDKHDRLWVTSSKGLVVFDINGNELYVLSLPKQPSNCAFGGVSGKELLITARDCVYLYTLK
ncbi:MAG: SMP-30/gluconolactonase/LRE family protein [Candidatus Hydrogenedentes bacterium]|nr:SMP-30/gluconolactonase/LRE family protein [Candidatus Hydrogenedentota bacterium]